MSEPSDTSRAFRRVGGAERGLRLAPRTRLWHASKRERSGEVADLRFALLNHFGERAAQRQPAGPPQIPLSDPTSGLIAGTREATDEGASLLGVEPGDLNGAASSVAQAATVVVLIRVPPCGNGSRPAAQVSEQAASLFRVSSLVRLDHPVDLLDGHAEPCCQLLLSLPLGLVGEQGGLGTPDNRCDQGEVFDVHPPSWRVRVALLVLPLPLLGSLVSESLRVG